MAILEGTTEDGALVPVQVTDAGRVVAEGLQGPEGPEGPQGEKGDKGDKGDPGSPGNLWSGTDPGDIYYDGGNVAIGSTSPSDRLHVEGGGLRIEEDNGATISYREATTGNAELIFRDAKAGSDRVKIDGSGRFLVGPSTARSNVIDGSASNTLTPELQVETANDDSSRATSVIYGRNNKNGAEIVLGKHRGGSVGDTNVVSEGDQLGCLTFSGSDGTRFLPAATVQAFVDGTPGTDDMPGRLAFSTTADGDIAPTERLRIDSQGDVIFQGAPIIKSPDGTEWKIVVDNNGNLSATT